MSKSGAILHGVVGIGAILVMGLRSCDDVFRATRHIDDVPVSSVGRSYDDIYRGADESVSSLDDVLSGNSGSLNKTVTADDELLMVAARNIDNMEPEKALPGEHIHYSNIDSVRYSEVDKSWFELVENPKLISLFPSNSSQYKSVYGKSPSISAESKLKSFNEQISAESSALKSEVEHADLILKTIEEADGSPVVILAHSEDGGRRVVFPDGTSMDVTDVHAQCIEALKRCMVLTCHGDDFGITENITASEALSIWKSVSSLAGSGKNIAVSDLVYQARKVRGRQKAKKKIIISWSAASILGTPFMKTSLHTESDDDAQDGEVASNKQSQPDA